MEYAIEVDGLKKSFGRVQAVDGISFKVRSGSLFAFLGPNGAGKSTTIDVLCTLTKYDAGTIRIAGYDLDRKADQIRSSIGVVFQDSVLDKKLSVKDNLAIRAGFYFRDKSRISQAIANAAYYTEIGDFMDRPYGRLSGGQRRRVDIARALLNTPQIMFLDEPTTGLDPQTRKHVWETIYRLQKEKDMTIFLTTHYMEEAAEAEYIVIMDKGQIVARGTPYELKEAYSYDHVKIRPKDMETVCGYLEKNGIGYEKMDPDLDIRVKDTMDALDLVTPIRQSVESMEVLHGTMDDVFLNITGRALRE